MKPTPGSLSAFSADDLIAELDTRLNRQGIGGSPIDAMVDFLRDGWTLLALPKDLVDRFEGATVDGVVLAELANELRARLMRLDAEGRS